MRLKWLVVAACLLLASLLAALAIAAHWLVPQYMAPALAASIKTETGREIDFGEVGLTLRPWPALVLSRLRFGNAPWGSQPWLAQVGRVSAEFDPLGLLSGRLRIRQVTLIDAQVLVETDAAGVGNWVMGSAGAGRPGWPEALEIEELELRSVTLTYREGQTGKASSTQLDSARIAAASAAHSMDFSARATLAGQSIEVAGTVGTLAALLANAPLAVDLEGRLGAARLSMRGTVDKPLDLGGFKLALKAQAAQAGEVAALFGATVPPLGPLRGTAQLGGTLAAPAFTDIDIALGGNGSPTITLSGSVADLRTMTGIDVRLAASATAWWHLGATAAGRRLPPFSASARVHGAQQGVRVDDLDLKIADSTVKATLQVLRGGPRLRVTGQLRSPLIDLGRRPAASAASMPPAAAPKVTQPSGPWKLADVDLDLQIERLVLPGGRELRSGGGRLALEDGRLSATDLRATLGGAEVRLTGRIDDPARLAGVDADLALRGGELAELFKFFDVVLPSVGPYQGQARLMGSVDALRLTAIDAAAGRLGQRLRASGQIDDALHWQGVALAITAEVGDSVAAGRLFGVDLPRLPALRATATLGAQPGAHVLDDLELALGRTTVQGRVAFAPGQPRPRVTAQLSGALVDLAELSSAKPGPGGTSPTLAADVEADIRFDRVVLPDGRSLGPVSGLARLTAGAFELKQFSVALEGARATLDGTIGDPIKLAALDLAVTAELTRGSGLAAFTGMNLRELPAFQASARLTDVADGYALAGLKIAHAATTLVGDAAVTRGARRLKLSAKLAATAFDASFLLKPDVDGGKATPAAPSVRAIADLPLPLGLLTVIDAELDLRIDAVKLRDAAPLGPLLLRAVLADGGLQAEPIELAGQGIQMLSLSGRIDAAQAQWDLRVDGKGVDLGALLARLGHKGVVTGGNSDLAMRLRGRGKTLLALLGSLDGDVRLAIGPLRLHNVAIDFDRGILPRVLGMANASHKTEPVTDIQCVAARVPIKGGVLTSDRGIAAETARYNVVLNGSLNLRTEAIDLAVTPVAKSGIGVGAASIAQIVRVGGTLGAPTLGVDAVGVARSAVGAGVAVMATPWWLADAVLKKVRSDPSPCATALGT